MSNVEFEGDNRQYAQSANQGMNNSSGDPIQANRVVPTSVPKSINWLMKKGIIKSPHVGQGILVGVVILNIVLIYLILKFTM